MATDLLEVCREYLEKAYLEKLGVKLSNSLGELGTGRRPVWCWVAASDLTSRVESGTPNAAGLLLDPEIGLLCYLIPFEAGTSMRKQVVRSLALRSQLAIAPNGAGQPAADSDWRGAWRVVVHWLVSVTAERKWRQQVVELRRETAFPEEISLDAIFLDQRDLASQLEHYGFPRLLLTTREVFRQRRLEETTRWLSASDLVVRSLSGFAAGFSVPEQRDLADEVVREMEDFSQRRGKRDAEPAPDRPRTLRRIRVRNFRNLRQVDLDFGPQPVSTRVVYGPNGTGKSSLCEAISLALFGCSSRYRDFADRGREKDVAAKDRGREYLEKYLASVKHAAGEPAIAMDDGALDRPRLVAADQIEDAELQMSGTILTQDRSLEFTHLSSDELAARVLRGYSDVADHIEAYTDGRVAQVNAERQNFLREFGLSASITKLDTAYERIARGELDQSLPVLPQALVAWLDQVIGLGPERRSDLPQRWRTWAGEDSRSRLARELSNPDNDRESRLHAVRKALEDYHELALRSAEFLREVESRIAPIRHELDRVAAQVAAWGDWLERRGPDSAAVASGEAETLTRKVSELQRRQQQIVEQGRIAAGRLEHLAQVEAYMRETWGKHRPEECPTCGANHADHGGIANVVESLRAKTTAERDRLRKEYVELNAQIDGGTKRLGELGYTQCPLSAEQESSLVEALQWVVPNHAPLSQWIAVKTQRDDLIARIRALGQLPPLPPVVDAEREAERIVQLLQAKFRAAEQTFEAPNNWKPVKDRLTKTLAGIVSQHLPNTLQRLWCELALNLTSAPWLLPDRPCFDVVTRRGEKRSNVCVQGRLARHLLNRSELHILGLAWFLARYLTHGRFHHACLVMDDPAHELDQTSFRDFCRLCETLLRLHRVYEQPLTLVLMLNQESRAIEAARATGGMLAALDWTQVQEEPVPAVSVIGEGFHAPQPLRLFQKTGT